MRNVIVFKCNAGRAGGVGPHARGFKARDACCKSIAAAAEDVRVTAQSLLPFFEYRQHETTESFANPEELS